MELPEEINVLNKRLIEHFGIDSDGGQPIWRISWSEDQFEKRLGTYNDITPAGIYLRTVTEVREVPKYRQWIKEKYVLERLVAVPDVNIPELPTVKLSYEPIWVFQDKDENYLPPIWDAAKFVIDTIYAAQYGPKNHSMSKYVDDEANQEMYDDKKKRAVDGIMEALWGEQSAFSDGIKSKETVMIGGKQFKQDTVKAESRIFLSDK